MKTYVDCDTVYDRLTRGPFRGEGENDRLVSAHLAVCHDCRTLAEALRPAVDLFHESMQSDERTQLPTYEIQGKPARRIAYYAVAPMLLVLLAGIGTAVMQRGATDGRPAVALAMNDPTVRSQCTHSTSTSENAPSVAVGLVNSNALGNDDAVRDREGASCCTHCHAAAGSHRLSMHSVVKLIAECEVCHQL